MPPWQKRLNASTEECLMSLPQMQLLGVEVNPLQPSYVAVNGKVWKQPADGCGLAGQTVHLVSSDHNAVPHGRI